MQRLLDGYVFHPRKNSIFQEFCKEFGLKISISMITPLASLWVLNNDYVIDNGYLFAMFEKMQIFCTPVLNVDAVFSIVHLNKGNLTKVKEVITDTWCDFDVVDSFESVLPHYRRGMPVAKEENGQLKLLVNALETIDSPNGKVVVIGGGGPYHVVSGLSYYSISEEVKTLNFEVYDPLDEPYMEKNYCVIDDFFDYSSKTVRPDVKYVIDDAYKTDTTECTFPPGELIDEIYPGYVGKFVVVVKHGVQCIVATPGSHKNHSYNHVLGGGEIDKSSSKVRIYGTSGTYGPYDRAKILQYFPLYEVYPATIFTNSSSYENLRRIFPNASISIKALPHEKYEGALIKKQLYYKGGEQRAYWKCNTIPEIGVECAVCHISTYAQKRLKITDDQYRSIFVKVGGRDCIPHKHYKKKSVMSLILMYARRLNEERLIITEITRKYGYEEVTVRSVLSHLVRSGDLVLHRSYDGVRYLNYKHFPPDRVIPPTRHQEQVLILSHVLNVSLTGQMSEPGKELGYVGDQFVPYATMVIPLNADIYTLKKYELSHDLVHGRIRLLIKKDYPRDVKKIIAIIHLIVEHLSYALGTGWRYSERGLEIGKKGWISHQGKVCDSLKSMCEWTKIENWFSQLGFL
jgi:hypothetical protein